MTAAGMAAARAEAGHGPVPGRVELHAPLFAEVIASLEGRRQVVMDLGRIQPATVALLSDYRCRLDVVDLPAALDRLSRDQPPDLATLEVEFQKLMPPAGDDTLTVILCWDLLNYLDATALEALMSALYIRSAPGTVLHALIAYSSDRMPAVPSDYAPAGGKGLVSMPHASRTVTVTRHTPKALEKRMHGFRAQRSVLLNNGMQEHLFRL